MRPRSLLIACAPLLGLSMLTTDVEAWSATGRLRATVHGHDFDRVELHSNGCEVRATLHFDAPKGAYASENPVRNVYRFRVRILLSGGHRVVSRVFDNREPGRRKYHYSENSGPDGCWGRVERKIVRVEVQACRNRGCRVPAFD